VAAKFKFTKDHAKVILDLGQEGASQKAMYAAIGVSKDTAAKLKKEDEFFAETMSMATTYGQAYWENMMLANIDNKGFNSRIAEIALRGQYPDDYKDRMDVKQNVKQEVTIDFNKEVSELIAALKL
jgi:N-methylhydantoinase B/oxoprolinase/acetone carboxylase alpha subunit